MCERFGVITVATAIVWKDGRLWFVPRRWKVGPLPLPSALLPKGESFESERDESYSFNVRVEAPIVGLIAAYECILRPQSPCPPGTS